MSFLKNRSYFSKYALLYLIYNIYTILGGSYVRATNSGAGCGKHWPLCGGKVIPNFYFIHTLIEFSHRISSALVTVGGILLVAWSFYIYEKGNKIRHCSLGVLFFIFLEALLGALLVLLGLVAKNNSNLRLIFMPLHLVTTFLLLATLVITYVWSKNYPSEFHLKNKPIKKSITSLLLLLFISCTGSITALSDTLFRPNYISENFINDIIFSQNILKILRSFHPILAIIISYILIKLLFSIKTYKNQLNEKNYITTNNYFKIFIGLTVIQIVIGFTNIFLLIPVWTQIIHLLTADLIWIYAIFFINSVFFPTTTKIKTLK